MTDIKKETLQTIYDALEILNENNAENITCFVGYGKVNQEIESLRRIIAVSNIGWGELDEDEIGEIETYVNRFDALEIVSKLLEESK